MITQSRPHPIRYIKKGNVEATHLDDEWILLNLDKYTVTKVNEVGGFLWSLLYEEQTMESLLKTIVAEYQMDSSCQRLGAEIENFLSELLQCGLIENVR